MLRLNADETNARLLEWNDRNRKEFRQASCEASYIPRINAGFPIATAAESILRRYCTLSDVESCRQYVANVAVAG
jgi:hypothetical protein